MRCDVVWFGVYREKLRLGEWILVREDDVLLLGTGGRQGRRYVRNPPEKSFSRSKLSRVKDGVVCSWIMRAALFSYLLSFNQVFFFFFSFISCTPLREIHRIQQLCKLVKV